MSNLQFDFGDSNSYGKSGDLFSSIFLFLFSLPFIGLGLTAVVKGLQQFFADRAWNNLFLALMGFCFFALGCGLMAAAILGKKLGDRSREKQMRFPDKPWMWRDDWAAGKIKSSTPSQIKVFAFMALVFCSVGAIYVFSALPKEWKEVNGKVLVVLIITLVGIGFFIAFINAWRSQRRFGDCYFELAQIPIPLGGTLAGMIQTSARLKLEHGLHLKLFCIRRITSGKNNTENILWQDEKVLKADLPEPEPSRTGIPVFFKLPADQPECFARSGEAVFWRLEAKAKMSGPDFHALFDVPVFNVAGTLGGTEAEAPDPTTALQEPIEDIRRDEHSKIKVTDGPDGREFYFPAARNLGTAVVLTVVFAGWSGLFWVLLHSKAPLIFPIFLGITDVLIGFGCFNAWFKSARGVTQLKLDRCLCSFCV